jgi:hypothetical protein
MLGTNSGELYYGEIQLDGEELKLDSLEVEIFKSVMQLPDYLPILDVKMAIPSEGWSMVLAISENKLYQFIEETVFVELFGDKSEVYKNLEANLIHFDMSLLQLDKNTEEMEQDSDLKALD